MSTTALPQQPPAASNPPVLPLEVLCMIFEHLDDVQDLRSARLVGRELDAIVTPLLFQKVCFNVSQDGIMAQAQELEYLAQSRLAQFVRELSLFCIADEGRTEELPLSVITVELTSIFERSIPQLQQLRKLDIDLNDFNKDSTILDFHRHTNIIFSSLQSIELPSLKHLSIQDGHDKLDADYGKGSRYQQMRHDATDQMIANAATLESLSLVCNPYRQFPLDLATATEHRLRLLELNGVEVQGPNLCKLIARVADTLEHFAIINSYICDCRWQDIFIALLACRRLKTVCFLSLWYHPELTVGMHAHTEVKYRFKGNPFMSESRGGDLYSLRDLLVELDPGFSASSVREQVLEIMREYRKTMPEEFCSLQEYRIRNPRAF